MRMGLMSFTKKLAMHAAALSVVCVVSVARADTPITSFTPGDLVALRGGDVTNPSNSGTTNQVGVYLDEYTPSGTYVGTMAVPQSGGSALTLPSIGDFQHQGVLSISGNGKWVSFAGYQAPAGSPDAFAQAPGSQYQPVVGEVSKNSSTLDTSTTVASYGAGGSPASGSPFIRGAYTNDGGQFWTFGKYAQSGATNNGGLAYVNGTGPSATTTTVEGFADWRDITSSNGQLYGGTGSSSVGAHGPYQVSTGQPTTNLGNSLSNNTLLGSYPGGQSASALTFINVPGGHVDSTSGARRDVHHRRSKHAGHRQVRLQWHELG